VYGTALWMITKGSLDLKDLIYEVLGPRGRIEDRSFGTPAEAFRTSLAMHSLFAHWSVNDWRWYIQWLEDTVDQEVSDRRKCKVQVTNSFSRQKAPSKGHGNLALFARTTRQRIYKTYRYGKKRPARLS
jgi:hypothetical protein